MIKQLTKLMIGSLIVYVTMHFVRACFFGDVVPVGFEQEPQSSWRVQFAFILLSVEFIAIGLSGLATILIVAFVVRGCDGERKIDAFDHAKLAVRPRTKTRPF